MITALVCIRDDGQPSVPGSVRKGCQGCGDPVLVAPSGQAELRLSPLTRVLCMGCALAEAPPDARVTYPRGAVEELEAVRPGEGWQEWLDGWDGAPLRPSQD